MSERPTPAEPPSRTGGAVVLERRPGPSTWTQNGGRADTTAEVRVLLVGLESMLASRTARRLQQAGYHVGVAGNEVAALTITERSQPDLVVLDVCPAGVIDLALFQRLRFRSDVPIVMLGAMADENDRVHGLNHGADDFVPQPVSPTELTARVTSVLRRCGRRSVEESDGCVVAGPVTISERTRQVRVREEPVALTALEFKLLLYFVHRPFTSFDRATLLEQVWGYTVGDGSTVTVHVRRLREKIELDPASPALIRTVWGSGYAFHPTGQRN
ncbi:MAG: response regulator transcription factor [Actinomycetota bacterium]|nr:response regulator transcription factor [Actinomycetota bacterium]